MKQLINTSCLVFLCGFSLLSCGKQRLNKEKETLVGKWKWVNSYTITPEPVQSHYITKYGSATMEFEKRNKLHLQSSSVRRPQDMTTRIKFVSIEGSTPAPIEFEFELKGEDGEKFKCFFTSESGPDTMYCMDFPIDSRDLQDGSIMQWNKFFRVE